MYPATPAKAPRARSPSSSASRAPNEQDAITSRGITIRFTGSDTDGGDLRLSIESNESVAQVLEKIRSARPPLGSSFLRLIHSGRLLTPGILLLPWLESLHARHAQQAAIGLGVEVGKGVGDMIRGAEVGLGKIGLIDERSEGLKNGERRSSKVMGKGKGVEREQEEIWIHCVVGIAGPPTSESDTTVTATATEMDPINALSRPRGFNALLEAGLNPAEVEQVRRQFYQSRGEEIPSGFEADDEHVRALEEQWIEGDLTNETAQTTNEGIYTSTLQGVLVGFLFPLMAWSFFKEPPAPNFFEPFEVEPGRRVGGVPETGASGTGGGQSRIPGVEDANAGNTGGTIPTIPRRGPPSRFLEPRLRPPSNPTPTARSAVAPSRIERIRRPFTLRGQAGGEWVVGVAFGVRVQLAILLGTVLNLAFGALRFLA